MAQADTDNGQPRFPASASALVRGTLTAAGPLIGLVFVWALFALWVGQDTPAGEPNGFIRWENTRLMLLQTAVVGAAAVGATLIIISGGIDLSVGSNIALGTMVTAMVLDRGLPAWAGALGGVASGTIVGFAIGAIVIGHVGRVAAAAAGLGIAWWMWGSGPVQAIMAGAAATLIITGVNEWAIGRLPLSPFIVTLGMWGALRGLAKGLGDNQPIYPADTGWVGRLMLNSGEGVAAMAPGIWGLLGLAILMAMVLRYTRFGRHVFAIGSNEETARLCGVHVNRTKLLIYTLGGACAGVAAVLQFAFLSMGDPTTAEGYELRVIAAAVIGGASLSGGEGSILGTILGALIMTIVDNGCTKLGLANWVQEVVTGAIIVAAVALDRLRQRTTAST